MNKAVLLRNCLRALYIVPLCLPLLVVMLPLSVLQFALSAGLQLCEWLADGLMRAFVALPEFERFHTDDQHRL